jgi:YwiC-like protein
MRLRSKLMLPGEHGAWVMLYAPFALGLTVAGRITTPALLLLVTTTATFIAREPLLIWWRARKRGRQTPSSIKAAKLLSVYLGAGAASGAALILIYDLYSLILFAMIGLALLTINGWQATRLVDRTVLGEATAIAGLTMTAPAAYYAVSGALNSTALWLWA